MSAWASDCARVCQRLRLSRASNTSRCHQQVSVFLRLLLLLAGERPSATSEWDNLARRMRVDYEARDDSDSRPTGKVTLAISSSCSSFASLSAAFQLGVDIGALVDESWRELTPLSFTGTLAHRSDSTPPARSFVVSSPIGNGFESNRSSSRDSFQGDGDRSLEGALLSFTSVGAESEPAKLLESSLSF